MMLAVIDINDDFVRDAATQTGHVQDETVMFIASDVQRHVSERSDVVDRWG